ncbi:MAG: LPS assembly lipoprotein LptE [Planctomycetota bacterium]
MNKVALAAVVLFLTLGMGCSYNKGTLIARQYESVRVPIFQNITRDRDIEFQLTRAVKNELERKNRLAIVDDPGLAQTELVGTITRFDRTVLTEDRLDRVRELNVSVTMNVTWTDLERQRTIRHIEGLTQTASARVGIGETEDQAAQEALRLVAQRIIEELEASW